MTGLLVAGCTVGQQVVDVRIRAGVVVEMGPSLDRDDEDILAAEAGALIPGLHDHHLHLFALAAELASVRCGPDAVDDEAGFATALRNSATRGPVRATGYFESVAGPLGRDVLDRLVPDVPVRVQHRSGSVWFLNSAALAATGLMDSPDPAVERDADGRPSGRVVRGDHLLRAETSRRPDLTDVGRLLASYGVTAVTDATPRLDDGSVVALHEAQDSGELPQRMLLLGAPLAAERAAGVPWKVVADELAGLDPVALDMEVRAAHDAGRPVAIHCTSRTETVLAATTLLDAGSRRGDRLEHAGILPRELDQALARAGVTVVTQPHFIAERGDDYLANVEPADHELLYRCATLLEAGAPVAFGTDAPFGRPDPWAVIAAAAVRRTRSGRTFAPHECVDARRALDAFLGRGLDPGGPARRVDVGEPADLCLLRVPLDVALAQPRADVVAATIIAGRVAYVST